jgi:hypothetical protein
MRRQVAGDGAATGTTRDQGFEVSDRVGETIAARQAESIFERYVAHRRALQQRFQDEQARALSVPHDD